MPEKAESFLTEEELVALRRRFRADQIEFAPIKPTHNRTQTLAVPYVDRRHIEERLDEVLGPARWRTDTRSVGNTIAVCIALRGHNGEWIERWDVGEATQVSPDKGAFTGGFKRAAWQWDIGSWRKTYFLQEIWLACKPVGEKQVRITDAPGWWNRMKEDDENGKPAGLPKTANHNVKELPVGDPDGPTPTDADAPPATQDAENGKQAMLEAFVGDAEIQGALDSLKWTKGKRRAWLMAAAHQAKGRDVVLKELATLAEEARK